MKRTKEQKRLDTVAKWYKGSHGFDGYLASLWFRSITPYLRRGSALEMGCADGMLTQHLVTKLAPLDVLDASPKYVKETLRKFPRIRNGYVAFFEKFKPEQQYDTIVAGHVLEHVQNPVTILKRITSWITPKGRLILIVPNAHSFHRLLGVHMKLLRKPTSFSDRDRALAHRRVYTPETLKQDIEAGGWKVETIGGVFFKILSNAQMTTMDKNVLEGLYKLGKDFPEHASDLFAICTRKR